MAKLTLRRRRGSFTRPAHEATRFVKTNANGTRDEYVIREEVATLLYHTDLGFPPGTESLVRSVRLPSVLHGTPHYAERAAEKGLPSSVTRDWVRLAKLIEVRATEDGTITRVLLRGAYSKTHDLCVVLAVRNRRLITGWTNSRQDWHRLDSEQSLQYVRVTA